LDGGLDEILTANRLRLPPELRRRMKAEAGFRRLNAHRQLPALGEPITIPHLESTG
jgi:hypothetical protein